MTSACVFLMSSSISVLLRMPFALSRKFLKTLFRDVVFICVLWLKVR